MDIDYRSAKEYLAHEHYYGRQVRALFLTGALIILLTLPLFASLVPVSESVSLGAIILVGFFAGLTNPLARSVAVINSGIAALAGIAFEYGAVGAYLNANEPLEWWFFAVNQVLAVIFFFALYFGSKTLRGIFFKDKSVR